MRYLMVSVFALTLSGCALPPAISAASLVIDVASFFFTGKTLSDHGISALAQQDCALLRIVQGEICSEVTSYDTAEALLTPKDETSQLASLSSEAKEKTTALSSPPAVSSPYGDDIQTINQQVTGLSLLPPAPRGQKSGDKVQFLAQAPYLSASITVSGL